ncbi:MAG: ArgR family transcriptional regulator [Acidobacteriota bacterium]
MNKSYRLGQILNIVRNENVRTQEGLAKALRRVGIEATQVTLSRDTRELGLIKTPEGYVTSAAVTPPGPVLETVVREFLLDVRVAQHTLVLRTAPGSASSLAEALDRADWPQVVGTIAGDNTILVVARDAKTAAVVRRELLALLG